MRLIVYHLRRDSEKSGWKVNGTYKGRLPTAVRDMSLPLSVFSGTCVRFFMLLQWKISGSNGTSEKVVLFFRAKGSKRKL